MKRGGRGGCNRCFLLCGQLPHPHFLFFLLLSERLLLGSLHIFVLLLLALVVGHESRLPRGLRARHLTFVAALFGRDRAQDVPARDHSAVVVNRPRGGTVVATSIDSRRPDIRAATKVVCGRPCSSAKAVPIRSGRQSGTVMLPIVESGRSDRATCSNVAAHRHSLRCLVSRGWPSMVALLGIGRHRSSSTRVLACFPGRRLGSRGRRFAIMSLVVRLRWALRPWQRWSVRGTIRLPPKEGLLSRPQLCVPAAACFGLLPPDFSVRVVGHLGRRLTVKRRTLLGRPCKRTLLRLALLFTQRNLFG